MPSDHPTTQHQRLWAIAGEWATSGHVLGDTPVEVTGSDVYEVLPGGYFMVHWVDVTVGSEQVRAVEVIGEPTAKQGVFLARSYDNHGNVEAMEVTVDDDGVFRFSGGPDIAPAAQPADGSTARVRSTLRVGPDGDSMSALWERSGDGVTWERWMDMTFQRRKQHDRP